MIAAVQTASFPCYSVRNQNLVSKIVKKAPSAKKAAPFIQNAKKETQEKSCASVVSSYTGFCLYFD